MRFIQGGSGLRFTIDRKLTRATLTGSLAVNSGHGEGPTGTPAVNITESDSYTDGYGTSSYRYSFTGRDASIAAGSRIGPMIVDDEPGESSTGQLGTYMTRQARDDRTADGTAGSARSRDHELADIFHRSTKGPARSSPTSRCQTFSG